MSVNRTPWSRERIISYKKYLQGDKERTFRGVTKAGKPYAKAVPVRNLIEKTSVKYSVKGGKLYADDQKNGNREVLSPEAVERMVKNLYRNKAIAVGKAPSIYQYMKVKYCGFGYKMIEKHMKSIPEYQLHQAVHLKKTKSRAVVISRAPGSEIDSDLMFFSKKYYDPSQNDNMQGLIVVVDRFSMFLAVKPISFGEKQKSAEIVSRKVEQMLRSDSFPKTRSRTIFTDGGVEYSQMFSSRMKQLGYNHVVISQAAGAPSPHAERAVGIIRKLINQKLSANAPPKAESQRWWPMARALVSSFNNTPLTDARAPHTPNQLKRMRGARAAAVVRAMQGQGAKNLGMDKNSRTLPGGAKVQKRLPVLQVGSRVRIALEKLSKDSGMTGKRPYPKQRWSSKIYTILRVVARKLGFARYTVRGAPRQRFEREDLQLIGKPGDRRQGVGAPYEDSDDIEGAVSKLAAKRTSR